MPRRAAVPAFVVVLAVSACSGSDAASNETRVPSPDAATETSAPVTVGSASTVPPDANDSGDDFCTAISAIQTAEFELEETFGTDARQLFDDVQSSAPAEVADDVAIVIEALDALAEVGISAEENDPDAVDAAFEILLDPDFTDASEQLEQYTSDACGIDLGDDDDADVGDLEPEVPEG